MVAPNKMRSVKVGVLLELNGEVRQEKVDSSELPDGRNKTQKNISAITDYFEDLGYNVGEIVRIS